MTFRKVLGSAPARVSLPEEQRAGHGALLTTGMAYIAEELNKLRPVLSTFASERTPELLAKSGCQASGAEQQSCLSAWANRFAEIAFRRTLRPDEAERLKGLVASADGTTDADAMAVEGVLKAVLFAPSFLYRTEIGAPSGNSAPALLTASELASKLSYLSTLGPPDEELRAAAGGGRLSEPAERLAQLERLAKTEDGERAIALMVLEWLGANEPKLQTKAAAYREGLGEDTATLLRASAEATVAQVLRSGEPTVRNLLATDTYAADEGVRRITVGAGARAGDPQEVARRGLLMHPLVLAAHTKENGSSPFQIGAFIKEVVLCDPVKAPMNAAAMARSDPMPGLSLREELEYRTNASATCSGCHATFAPLGYAFMAFDPVGRWLGADPSGKPWDFSGEVSTYLGDALRFETPAELAVALAESPQVQACFARSAVEWSVGHRLSQSEQSYASRVQATSRRTQGNVLEILREIVGAPEFNLAQGSR